MSPDIDDVFRYCNLGGEHINCSLVLQKSLTSEGICFTFNMLSPAEMFFER